MVKTDGVRLVLKLKSDRTGQIYMKNAAHMRLDGAGRLLLYDGSHRLIDAISLADHTVTEIMPVHWAREDADFSRETPARHSAKADTSKARFESTFTIRLAISSEHIANILR